MNRKQRDQNRANAWRVVNNAIICPECGGRGAHWDGLPVTLQHIIDKTQPRGFWICAKVPEQGGEDGK
ncbi:MAG TPA: hypothetical protein DCK83_02150 [Gallionellaceae bacterium]|nr:hypothetical protein [Gallionellaceae bacterium]